MTEVATIVNIVSNNPCSTESIVKKVRVRYGYSRKQGHRPYQEDNFSIIRDDEEHEFLLLGVFDGHGTSKFSKHAKENLFDIILAEDAWQKADFKKAIMNGFLKEDEKMKAIDNAERGGTTATVALITEGKLFLANVGDSSALIAQELDNAHIKSYRMSRDHNLDDPGERERVNAVGGNICGDRVVEEGHAINMTRALGDFEFKRENIMESVMSPIPHVVGLELDQTHKFLILGSDGLWDFISDQELVQKVSAMLDSGVAPQEITDKITADIHPLGGSDNVTMILVVFDYVKRTLTK